MSCAGWAESADTLALSQILVEATGNCGEDEWRVFFPAGGYLPELLGFAEVPLDRIALAIGVWRDGPLLAQAASGRDMCLIAACGHAPDQNDTVVAAIRRHGSGGQRLGLGGGGRLVRHLPPA